MVILQVQLKGKIVVKGENITLWYEQYLTKYSYGVTVFNLPNNSRGEILQNEV